MIKRITEQDLVFEKLEDYNPFLDILYSIQCKRDKGKLYEDITLKKVNDLIKNCPDDTLERLFEVIIPANCKNREKKIKEFANKIVKVRSDSNESRNLKFKEQAISEVSDAIMETIQNNVAKLINKKDCKEELALQLG